MKKSINRKPKMGAKRVAALGVAVLMLLCSLSFSAFAKGTEARTIRIGYYENEVFQEGAAKGSVRSGYAYEYYRKLSEYTGWKYEYIYGSFIDLYQQLLDGKIDLLAGLSKTPEREGLLGFPDEPMGRESYNLVKHSDDTHIVLTKTALKGKKIGVINSVLVTILKNYLSKNSIDAEVVVFDDYDEMMDAFDEKTIDVLAVESDGIRERDDAEDIGSFGEDDYYICVNIRRSELLDELNKAQSAMKVEDPNFIDMLEERYYPTKVSPTALSEEEREWIKDHKTLNVGYLNNFLPYSDTESNGEATGIVKEIFERIFDELDIKGMKITYRGYDNYNKMIKDINYDAIDVAFPAGGGSYYAEESGIYLSNTVVSSNTELVFKGNFVDQTTEHFAVNENNRLMFYYVKAHFPDAEISFYPTIEDCLNAVVKREVTCTVLGGLRASEIMKNSAYDGLNQRPLGFDDDRCFGVELGNEGLLRLLDRGLAVIGNADARSMAYRYSSEIYTYTILDALKDNALLVGGVIVLLAALIIFLLIRDSKRKRAQLVEIGKAKNEMEEMNLQLAKNKEALSHALVAAEQANCAKTDFLNNMSHDIRTPMNAIIGFTAMAATHIDNKDQVKDYLGKISVSSNHLLSLINDVLDMSRIESGNMKIEEGEVHLPDLVHDIRTIIQANVASKQIDLFIDNQDVCHEDIITDKLRLNQALLNILTNAVKFTPNGGIISFRVIEKPCDTKGMTIFEFRIKDNGIGMSEEFQKTIFDAFSRENSGTVSRIQGTGLGMAITKNIVDLLNGTITVHSEVGVGSEFVVTIPCKISENSKRFAVLEELKGLRALVADDDTNTCLSVCSMLREIGMRPDWTNYGKEAVVRAKEAFEQSDRFRVYIIDWMMPDMNGIETVRRIRQVIDDNDMIIILTAYDWADIEEEAREAGVTAFCAKPLFMSELKTALATPLAAAAEDEKEEKKEEYDFAGKRLLIAEDNELNQMIAVSILEEAGFAVEVAHDGAEAVQMVEYAAPGYYDAILMDIQMPKMDGYEAAKRIRLMDNKQRAESIIVAVTANAFDEDRRISLSVGMNGHLAKPYDIPEMLALLDKLINETEAASPDAPDEKKEEEEKKPSSDDEQEE